MSSFLSHISVPISRIRLYFLLTKTPQRPSTENEFFFPFSSSECEFVLIVLSDRGWRDDIGQNGSWKMIKTFGQMTFFSQKTFQPPPGGKQFPCPAWQNFPIETFVTKQQPDNGILVEKFPSAIASNLSGDPCQFAWLPPDSAPQFPPSEIYIKTANFSHRHYQRTESEKQKQQTYYRKVRGSTWWALVLCHEAEHYLEKSCPSSALNDDGLATRLTSSQCCW